MDSNTDATADGVFLAPKSNLWIVLTGAMLAMVMAAVDQNIVNTALPRMAGDLGGLSHLSWVITAFMLTATMTTPLYGKASDVYGRRILFFVSIIVFLTGSFLCGAAQDMTQLILFRALQGLGAGGLMVLAQAAVADVVSPRQRPRYQGLFTGTFAFSSVVGPLLGGVITSLFSWRWVFYINLPVGVLALAMIATGLPRKPGKSVVPIDYLGAFLLALVTTALLLLLTWGGVEFAWWSTASFAIVAAMVMLFLLFLRRESLARDPLLRLALFRNPVFARGVGVSGMMSFAMLGSTVLLPLYFQLVLGMDPAVAGAMLLPQVGGMLLTSIVGGQIVARMGRNRPFLLAGIGLEAVALAGLAVMAFVAAPPGLFLIGMGLLGLGMGMGMPNLTTAVQNAVAHGEVGAATGAMAFLRSLGGALGVATSGAIMTSRLAAAFADDDLGDHMRALTEHGLNALAQFTPAQQLAVATSYRTALMGCFMLSGAVMSAAFLLVMGLPEMRLRSTVENT
jgi:EmrB/QacA subfamily drug resistance transporter